jgi:hypothetical protein
VETGELISGCDLPGTRAGALAITPNGQRYVAGTRVLTVEGHKEIAHFNGPKGVISGGTITNDGRRVVSGSSDGTVRVWELKTGRELLVFDKHKGNTYVTLAISPDDRWVLSGSTDGVIRLWELSSGREIHSFDAKERNVVAVGFVPSRPFAYSVCTLKDPCLWRLPKLPDAPMAKLPDLPTGGKDLVAIDTEIDKAKSDFEAELKKAKDTLLQHYTKLITKLDKAGNKTVSARVRAEMGMLQTQTIIVGRDALKESILQYGHSFKKARDTLAATYAVAITNYKKASETDMVKVVQAELTALAPDAPLVSLEAFGTRRQFVAHADYLGCLKPSSNAENRINATFEVVPGLADKDHVSFRSVNVPHHYLAHGDFRIRLQKLADLEGYRQNATFKQVKGLASADAVSFESVNYPGYYIRARGTKLFLEKSDGSDQFHREATFIVAQPQFKLW